MVISGASWGGYVTLQAIGTVPDGWRAAMAVVPVADYLSAYADESEALQAFDRSLFGGGPEERDLHWALAHHPRRGRSRPRCC